MEGRDLGLLLSLLSGLATAIGALVVFFIRDLSARPFVICMAAAAGVMFYVSLVELFATSVQKFASVFPHEGHADGLATLSFLGGWMLLWGFDRGCHWLLAVAQRRDSGGGKDGGGDGDGDDPSLCAAGADAAAAAGGAGAPVKILVNDDSSSTAERSFSRDDCADAAPGTPCRCCDAWRKAVADARNQPVKSPPEACPPAAATAAAAAAGKHVPSPPVLPAAASLRVLPAHIAGSQTQGSFSAASSPGRKPSSLAGGNGARGAAAAAGAGRGKEVTAAPPAASPPASPPAAASKRRFLRLDTTESEQAEITAAHERFHRAQKSFLRVGIFTAIALTVHNFPEGLATFTSSLANVKFGAGVAIAMAIHNIPEGFAVAVPVYYATGSRWKAFAVSSASGLAEPLAGLIAYVAIGEYQDERLFGTLFGLTSGVMCNLALRELLPSAIKYDPADRLTTLCVTAAIAAIAVALVTFKIVGV